MYPKICTALLSIGLGVASSSGFSEELESVVVSASPLLTDKNALAVPVSVLTQQDLDTISATHPNEIAAHSPGVWVSRGDGQEHLTAIRSPVFTGAGACGAFFIAEDSIAVRAPGFCNVNQLFDTHYELASSFEVFRGPSSSVFGSNALFGGVNVISPDRSSTNLIGLELGSNDFKRLQLNVLDPSKSYHAYSTFTDSGSFREQAGYKQQKLGLKHYTEVNAWSSTSSVQVSNFEQETAGFIEGFESYRDDDLRKENLFPEAYRDAQSIRAYSRWEKQKGTSLFVVQPFVRLHRMEFLMHFVPWQPVETNEHDSVGLKLLFSKNYREGITFTAGADIDVSSGELVEFQAEPAPFAQENFPQGTHHDYSVESQSVSPFFEVQYAVSERLQLNSQFRWEALRYDYTNNTSDGFACDDDASACRFFRPESGVNSFSSPSWRLGLLFEANDDLDLFASIASAYRAPQTAELYRAQSELQADLDTVSVEGVDIGLRNSFNRFSYELNVYSMRRDNAIYQDTNRQYLVGAETSHKGIEYDFDFQFGDNFKIGSTGSYAVHEYENSPEFLGVEVDISGNKIDTSPKWLLGIRSSLIHGKHSIELAWNALSSYYVDPENDNEYGGHELVNLSWSFRLSAVTELQLKLNNLLDTRYAERADFAFGDYRYFPGAGRTANLRFRQNF